MSDQLELDLNDGYSTVTGGTSGAAYTLPTATPGGVPVITTNNSGQVSAGSVGVVSGGTVNWIPIGILSSGNYSTITGVTSGSITGWSTVDVPVTAPKVKNNNGCTCKNCKEFFPYAESNQDDGTLICYGCKLWM